MTAEELLQFVPKPDALQGRTILVTGAGDGIGKQLAIHYARFGASVVLLDKNIPELEAVFDTIVDAGHPEPAIYPLDLSGANADHYRELASIIQEQMGGLDGLVLNAAWLPGFMPIDQWDTELWQKTILTNLTANYLLFSTCLPMLKASDHASVIYSAHTLNRAYAGAFGVAKAAMESLMAIVADEFDGDTFIRVNSIDPGPLLTRMRRANYPGETPQSLATPSAVMGPYLYFMSEVAGKRTGEVIRYDRLGAGSIWPGN